MNMSMIDNNPFQIQLKPFAPKIEQPESMLKKLGWKWITAISVGAVSFVTVVSIVYLKTMGNAQPFLALGNSFSQASGAPVYHAQAGFSQEQARQTYQTALAQQKAGEYEKALATWKTLEPVYPGLKDFLWFHQAEAYASLGNEWAVQKKLDAILQQYMDTPLKGIATYHLAQSHFRAKEWEKAKQQFEKLQNPGLKSDYQTGSLYYLGKLALLKQTPASSQKQTPAPPATGNPPDPEQIERATGYFTRYLEQCDSCTFSAEAARELSALVRTPTALQHQLIGAGLLAEARPDEMASAIGHLNQGSLPSAWFALGKAQLASASSVMAGKATLIHGLRYAKQFNDATQAIDLVLGKTATASEKTVLLTEIVHQKPALGADYALWKLSEINSGNAASYYNTLVKFYPESDYAPESQWQLLRPLVQQNNPAYVTAAQSWLTRYGYARSAPKVHFWLGKFLEKTSKAEAIKAYRAILAQYPSSYYAFRSEGRLKVLVEGLPDTGWSTPFSTQVPLVNQDFTTRLATLPILPESGSLKTNHHLRSQATELQAIQAPDDLTLLVKGALGDLPVLVESWCAHASGNISRGIRLIREAMANEAKVQFQTRHSTASSANGAAPSSSLALAPALEKSDTAIRLLYPGYYQSQIRLHATKNNINPLLVQSLMREESYFNPLAVSGSNARGLMQLLPTTATEVAQWEKLSPFAPADLFVPDTNIQLGSRYLGHLHQLFNGNPMYAVGAYNGGPGAMQRWKTTLPQDDPDRFVENIPYEQSRHYIEKVFGSYWNYKRL
jgi:soluble lytic murein transglycosylase